MKHHLRKLLPALLLMVAGYMIYTRTNHKHIISDRNFEKEDGIKESQELEFKKTKDPSLGVIPKYRLYNSIYNLMRERQSSGNATSRTESLSWTERGSYTDDVGPSNGNGRPGTPTPVTSGRMRAVWVDLADATNKTVWVGGVDGGIWKTTDITASPATWSLVNDFFGNLAIASICQDPTNNNIMYFGTGEKAFNLDAVEGGGVWKSTDHGVTWSLLANTTGFWNVSKILCDAFGNVYVGTIGSGNGLQRSTDGGTSWTNITPTINAGGGGNINTTRVADMAYDAASNKLHVVMGYLPGPGSGIFQGYCYTTNPSTVTSSTWTAATTTFITSPNSLDNCAIACKGNTVYATPANTSDLVSTIYKSTDGGTNWSATGSTPSNSGNNAYTSGQGWYCLALGIDPSNASNVIVGSLNCYKTTDGGTSWSQISVWVSGISGSVTNYIHADQHFVAWNGSQVLVGSDGGIFYSANNGSTFTDRNINLRLKQFYSCAIHPTTTNYFLAGAQDNGVHQFNGPGLTSSVEVTGGDGAFVAIDQNQSSYQFGSYVYSHYHRTTNGGSTWSDFDFYNGTAPANYTEIGSFINPFDYDNANNIFYAAGNTGEFFLWTNPQTLAPGTYHANGSGFPSGVSLISITGFNSANVSTVMVSPYTSNRVYFGTEAGRVVQVDAANTISSGSAGTNITGASFPAGNVSCINVGTNDNNLIATFSNYGVSNVWISTNGGTSWTAIDGNLPDMPVRWAMFYPNNNTRAILATEMGIYETTLINGASTFWTQNSTFPVVRTDMLQYRASDQTIVAATHGRGLWTTTIPIIVPVSLLNFQGQLVNNHIDLDWNTASEQNSKYFEIQKSLDGMNFFTIGNVNASGNSSSQRNYHFTDEKVAELNYYRLKMSDADGHFIYSKIILVRSPGAKQDLWIVNNPFETFIKVRLAKQTKQKIKIALMNTAGEKLFYKELGNSSEFTIDLSATQLSKGVYFLKAEVDGNSYTRRLVKE
jgi:hypothetical protein